MAFGVWDICGVTLQAVGGLQRSLGIGFRVYFPNKAKSSKFQTNTKFYAPITVRVRWYWRTKLQHRIQRSRPPSTRQPLQYRGACGSGSLHLHEPEPRRARWRDCS